MSSEKPLILVVDDDVPIQLLMQTLLREFGFECLIAGSGDAALKHVRDGARPHLVLLDINMPGMSAAEAIRAFRAEGLTGVPIVILSGERVAGPDLVLLGADGAVQKPFDVPELVAQIRGYVAR